MRSAIALSFFLLAALLAVVLAAINQQPVNVWLMGHTAATVPASALVLAGVVLGGIGVASLMQVWKINNSSDEAKRLSNWQAQDTKLIAEIKSDREKQLEAKIATLEAALKASLKKT